MSTQTRELVATPDAIIGFTETALKQLTVMFNRIAISGLFVDYSKVPFVSTDFTKLRTWLAELGILFDLDIKKLASLTAHNYVKTREVILEDTNSYTKPTFGMSHEEMIAARNDEEKAAELKRRAAEAQTKLADGSLDPQKMMELSLRMSTNMMRMLACQLRDAEDVDAYSVIPPELSSFEQDDQRLTKYDVLRVALGALPVPVDNSPWQQLIEYRNDPETKNSFLLIKDWMTEAARGSFTPVQVEESLEYLLNRFRENLESHGINTTTTTLYAYVVTTPKFLEMLAGVGPTGGTRALFSMEHCRLGLLEGEATTAGSVLAFLLQADLGFPAEGFAKEPA